MELFPQKSQKILLILLVFINWWIWTDSFIKHNMIIWLNHWYWSYWMISQLYSLIHTHPSTSCNHTLTSLSLSFTLWLQEEDDENLYTSIQRLRDRTSELSIQVSLLERSGSADLSYQQSLEELRAAQDQLNELVEARNRRWLIIQHTHTHTAITWKYGLID